MEGREIHYHYYPGGVSVVLVEGLEKKRVRMVAFLTDVKNGCLASRWKPNALLLTKDEAESIRKNATKTVADWYKWSLDMNHQCSEDYINERFETLWNKSYRCDLPEPALYRIITNVQCGSDVDKCDRLYQGEGYGTAFSDCNGEAVIDYLKEWDYPEIWKIDDDLTLELPRWVSDGSDSVYEKDGYFLTYSSKLGGVYMLYRKATEEEINIYLNYKNESE